MITGAGWILRASWERGRCAYIVFEAGRARLAGAFTPTGANVQVTEDAAGVSARGVCGGARENVRFLHLENRGSVTPPMLVVFALVVAGLLGTWTLLNSWKGKARLQLALDACMREQSLSLKRDVGRLGDLNTLIHATRKSISAGTLLPPARAAAQAALHAQVLAQEALLGKWRLKQAAWLAGAGCAEAGRSFGTLPSLPCVRGLPDLVGPQALRWRGPGALRLRLQRSNRISVAELRSATPSPEVPHAGESTSWPSFRARWCADSPKLLGASAP